MVGLSIVVVTWNSAPELSPLLASIEQHVRGRHEIVVVDNASSDGTADLADAWEGGASTVIRLAENRGYGAANNCGVRSARYDVVAMLNPDTLLFDGSLERLAELARTRRALCGPELLDVTGSRQPSASAVPAGWEMGLTMLIPAALMPRRFSVRCEPWRAHLTTEVGWLTGACVLAPRDILVSLGPFDESIHLYSEDMDLGIRARAAGVRSLYTPDVAKVTHLGDRSSARRFSDSGLQLSIENRRRVVRARYGRARERYDFSVQIVALGVRWLAKQLLRRDAAREARWLKTAARVLRNEPA